MVVLNRVLVVTKQLSVSLQEVNKDLAKCLREVKQQANLLHKMREDSDSSFAALKQEAECSDATRRTSAASTDLWPTASS